MDLADGSFLGWRVGGPLSIQIMVKDSMVDTLHGQSKDFSQA